MHMPQGHTETSEEQLGTQPTPTGTAKRTSFGALMDFLLFGELHASAVILFQILRCDTLTRL